MKAISTQWRWVMRVILVNSFTAGRGTLCKKRVRKLCSCIKRVDTEHKIHSTIVCLVKVSTTFEQLLKTLLTLFLYPKLPYGIKSGIHMCLSQNYTAILKRSFKSTMNHPNLFWFLGNLCATLTQHGSQQSSRSILIPRVI